MAGGGISGGPTPWWQTSPKMGGALTNLQNSAPAGYQYDPISMGYVRTPQSAGSNVNAFENAAFPSLAGITGSLTGALGSATDTGAAAGTGSSTGAVGVGTGTGAPGSSGPVSSGNYVASVQMPDMTASNNAQFAAAKDQVAQTSRASLDSLNGELGAQGMLGSGAQAQDVRDVVNNNAEQEGQVSRNLATQNANTALDVAKTNYQGSLTQRGQDIQAQQANAQLALEARGQQYQLLNTILNGISKIAPGAGSSSPYSLSPSLLY